MASKFLYLSLKLMDLVVNWIKVDVVIYINTLLVSIAMEMTVVKPFSKILAMQLAVQMIS